MIKLVSIILALVLIVPTIGYVGFKTVAYVIEGNEIGSAIGCGWNDWMGVLGGIFGEAKADEAIEYKWNVNEHIELKGCIYL